MLAGLGLTQMLMALRVSGRGLGLVLACGAMVSCGSGSGGSGTQSRPADTAAANAKPTIAGTPPLEAIANVEYEFQPEANDTDGDTLTFHVVNRPEWATFSPSTGRLFGTPPASARPLYTGIEISVTDGKSTSSLPPFDLAIAGLDTPPAVNRPPAIAGMPAQTATVALEYVFEPTVSDPDGGTLLFSVANRPGWASFSTRTGMLRGTPAASDVGIYPSVTITVSDGYAEATLPEFSIAVVPQDVPPPNRGTPGPDMQAENRAPSISGVAAATVTANEWYSFAPFASDPDGDALRFSIDNKPPWANFNTSTGRLSGTPSPSDTGTYSNIRITASDGELSATLPGFTIAVQDLQPGSAILSWAPPTRNEDGSPLTDLKGYKIYYGKSVARLDTVLDIPNPGISTASVSNLSPANWFFVVTAYNRSDVESAPSNAASKTIR